MDLCKELQDLNVNPSEEKRDSIEAFLYMKYGKCQRPDQEVVRPAIDKLNLKETRPLFYDAKMKIKGNCKGAKLVIANPIKRAIVTIVHLFT